MTHIIDLHEREVRAFPRDYFISAEGRSLIFPEVRDLTAFEIKDTADGVNLRVLGLIGYLPITQDVALNLRPKFPTENLWHMLDLADESFSTILPTVRRYEAASQSPPHQLLARAFTHYVRNLLGTGFARSYVRERKEGYFQPKVAFGATVSRYWARGDHISTVSDAFSFTSNVAANQILKTACTHFLKVMPHSPDWQDDRHTLSGAIAAFGRVAGREMMPGDLSIAERLPTRVRGDYRGALTTYAILRGLAQLGFEYASEGSELPSFLFNLDTIFEAYVRNSLRIGLAQAGISVVDGNKTRHQRPLFSDNNTYPVKPDLIFRRSKAIVGTGEVKYKKKIDESDRYQLISHTLALGASLGVWFSPAPTSEAAGLEYVGAFAGKGKFYHYRLDLAKDLKQSTSEMVNSIKQLLDS